MSAFAATLISAAVIPAPRLGIIEDRELGPRLLAIEAGIPARARCFAMACPMLPAPMIPIVMLVPHLGYARHQRAWCHCFNRAVDVLWFQNMPWALAWGTFGASHGAEFSGLPTTCRTS